MRVEQVFAGGAATEQPGARALLSANQSIPSNAWSTLDLDVVDWDIDGDFDIVNHWFECPNDGVYMICVATKVLNVTNATPFGCSIYVNGALAGGRVTFVVGGTANPGSAASDMLELSAGDHIQCAAFQRTGANRDVQGGNIFTNYLAVKQLY